MNNKSTDMQVYNESKQQSKNLLVYYLKTTVAFIHFFLLTRMKTRINLTVLNMKVYEYIWKISKYICPKPTKNPKYNV